MRFAGTLQRHLCHRTSDVAVLLFVGGGRCNQFAFESLGRFVQSCQFGLRSFEFGQLRHQLGGIGFQIRHNVFVGRCVKGSAHGAAALRNQTQCAPHALGQGLQLTQGAGEVLFATARDFGRGGRRQGVKANEFTTQIAIFAFR